MNYTLVERTINYYELDFNFISDSSIATFFEALIRLTTSRAKIRYQKIGDRHIFIQGIKNEGNIIFGKLRSIRVDLFPEIINMTTDEVSDIVAGDTDGVMETTHFIIDFRRAKTFLGIEYNHPGAKITDLVGYIQRIGLQQSILDKVGFIVHVNPSLDSMKERINRLSEFSMKIHRNNIHELRNVDGNIMQSAAANVNHFENEYAILNYKFDYQKFTDTPQIKKTVLGFFKYFEENPNKKYLFNYLKFKAEDKERNNLLQNFDMLLDRTQSKFKVQKKKKSKTIISEDMFPKMLHELNKHGFR